MLFVMQFTKTQMAVFTKPFCHNFFWVESQGFWLMGRIRRKSNLLETSIADNNFSKTLAWNTECLWAPRTRDNSTIINFQIEIVFLEKFEAKEMSTWQHAWNFGTPARAAQICEFTSKTVLSTLSHYKIISGFSWFFFVITRLRWGTSRVYHIIDKTIWRPHRHFISLQENLKWNTIFSCSWSRAIAPTFLDSDG